jgi:predicted PurR-regulated permease PerM
MRDTKLILILLAILVAIALGFVLNLLEPILIPFVVSVFLFQIFTPLMEGLRRRGVSPSLSIILVLIVVSAVLMLSSWILYSTALSFSEALPEYGTKLRGLLDQGFARLATAVPQLRGPIARWRWEEAVEISSVTGFLAAGVGSFLVFFSDLVLILLFLVFLLAGSASFPVKLGLALAPRRAERVAVVMRNIEEQVRQYLLTKTLINLLNGVLVTALMASFGVDFPLLWGLLTFLAHYIPQIGGVLSVGFPAVFLFLQFDSPGMALLVAALNAVLQFVIGNLVEPRVMGTRLNLSPLLVLLSLIFWGWLWGPWGMVLAVPITATIKIVCENVVPLQSIAVLMSDTPEAEPREARAEGTAVHPAPVEAQPSENLS